MLLNGKEYDIGTLVKNLDTASNSFVKVGNLMLTKREVNILKRNFIKYECASSLSDLRIKIEELMKDESLDEDYSYELESVLDSITERDYYDYRSHDRRQKD